MTLTSSSSSSSSPPTSPSAPKPSLPLDFPFVGGDPEDLDPRPPRIHVLPPELLPGTMSSISDTPLPVGEGVERVQLPSWPGDLLPLPPLIFPLPHGGPASPPSPIDPLVAAVVEAGDEGRVDWALAIPDKRAASLMKSVTIPPTPVSKAALMSVAAWSLSCECCCCLGEERKGGAGKGMGDCSHWGAAESTADSDVCGACRPIGVPASSSSEESLVLPAAAPRPTLISVRAFRMSRVSDRPEDVMLDDQKATANVVLTC